LHRFPIDYLKIDRSFVEKVTDRDKGAAMVKAIVTMATALGLKTIAEGIETEAQADTLREIGCWKGQGYLFSAPLSSSEMDDFLFGSFAIPGLARVERNPILTEVFA
jgi:EAL domain-containing protein (putative c-di-GMP-specific phosphodiesterase class I)